MNEILTPLKSGLYLTPHLNADKPYRFQALSSYCMGQCRRRWCYLTFLGRLGVRVMQILEFSENLLGLYEGTGKVQKLKCWRMAVLKSGLSFILFASKDFYIVFADKGYLTLAK